MNTEQLNLMAKSAVLMLAIICLTLAGIYTGSKYKVASQIVADKESQFKKAAENRTLTLLAEPINLKLGQKFTAKELTKHLNSVGYSQTEAFGADKSGTFEVTDNIVKISPRYPTHDYKSVEITFSKNKITSIEDLKTADKLKDFNTETGPIGVFVIDSTNGSKVRAAKEFVNYETVKDSHLVRAIISSEDGTFFSHNGVNYQSITRDSTNLVEKKVKDYLDIPNDIAPGGASTITQQLVKNILLSSEKTFDRKIDEAFLAAALENFLAKEEILELYLNTVYLGQIKDGKYVRGIYGIQSASRFYYGKNVQDLSVGQAAVLAGLLNAPNKYQGNADHPALLERKERTLDLMRRNYPDNYNEKTIEQAKLEDNTFETLNVDKKDLASQPFVNFALLQLKKQSANLNQDSVIQTPLKMKILEPIDSVLSNNLEDFQKKIQGSTGRTDLEFIGSVVIANRENGDIISMNSLRLGKDGKISPDNAVFENPHQIASSIKPFIVLYGEENNMIELDSVIDPNDCTTPNWIPEDSSVTPDTLGKFLVSSKNKAFVCVLNQSGYKGFRQLWNKFRSSDCDEENVRIANGFGTCAALTPLELALAYSIFPDGKLKRANAISKIFQGGTEVNAGNFSNSEQIFNSSNTSKITEKLRAVVDRDYDLIEGATAAELKRQAGLPQSTQIAGKSGSGTLDFWMNIITPQAVMTVHLGIIPPENLNTKTPGIFSGSTSVPLAVDVLREINRISPELLQGKFKLVNEKAKQSKR